MRQLKIYSLVLPPLLGCPTQRRVPTHSHSLFDFDDVTQWLCSKIKFGFCVSCKKKSQWKTSKWWSQWEQEKLNKIHTQNERPNKRSNIKIKCYYGKACHSWSLADSLHRKFIAVGRFNSNFLAQKLNTFRWYFLFPSLLFLEKKEII